MQEKYYIDINENRKIIGRYLLSFHGENMPTSVKEVSQDVFETSIQENHNYLNEDLTTCEKDTRTPEEIAEEERLAKLPSQEEIDASLRKIEILDTVSEMLTELGVI